MHSVAHLALGFYMLWSNIKVSDSTKPSYSPLHADLLQRDRKQGQVTSYEDQLKGEEAGMHDLTEFENPYHRPGPNK
ncbi:hypothetical protein TRAPUB_3977 [Trametes pubescens]|uniref:Uncharacterized protein n=1 Tax=Trametes pubescens TaxID=154538 RepID=A0A1M2VCB1_TRAPU|nr:hypothetical protein TRAPUB_3977 [Trametes pubescens]